jgi:RecB family endonuclease NucS
VGFPDEETWHALIAEAPQRLPLSGSRSLVVVGREVQVGSGRADLTALEPSGQVAIIAIKLARHAEARRAVGHTAASAPILSP